MKNDNSNNKTDTKGTQEKNPNGSNPAPGKSPAESNDQNVNDSRPRNPSEHLYMDHGESSSLRNSESDTLSRTKSNQETTDQFLDGNDGGLPRNQPPNPQQTGQQL